MVKRKKLRRSLTGQPVDVRNQPQQPGAPAMPAATQDDRGTRTRKALIWITTTVLASVVGTLVTLNIDAIKNWLSERKPLEYHVAVTEGPSWYDLFVADPSRLPPDVGKVKD